MEANKDPKMENIENTETKTNSGMIEGLIGLAIGAGAMYMKSQADKQQLERSLDRQSKDAENYLQTRIEVEQTASQLREELAQSREDKRRLENRILDLEEKLEDKEIELSRLRQTLHKTQAELDEYKVALQAAQQRNQ